MDLPELVGDPVHVSGGAIEEDVEYVKRRVPGEPGLTDLADQHLQDPLVHSSERVDDGVDSDSTLGEAPDVFESHRGCGNVVDADVMTQECEERPHVFQECVAEKFEDRGIQGRTLGGLDEQPKIGLEVRGFPVREAADQHRDGVRGTHAGIPGLHRQKCN